MPTRSICWSVSRVSNSGWRRRPVPIAVQSCSAGPRIVTSASCGRGVEPLGGSLVELPVPAGVTPPSMLAPFAGKAGRVLVDTYSTVPYNDVDPTVFATIAYVVMFGMMFGDVGHGAIVAALGLVARRLDRPSMRALQTRVGDRLRCRAGVDGVRVLVRRSLWTDWSRACPVARAARRARPSAHRRGGARGGAARGDLCVGLDRPLARRRAGNRALCVVGTGRGAHLRGCGLDCRRYREAAHASSGRPAWSLSALGCC